MGVWGIYSCISKRSANVLAAAEVLLQSPYLITALGLYCSPCLGCRFIQPLAEYRESLQAAVFRLWGKEEKDWIGQGQSVLKLRCRDFLGKKSRVALKAVLQEGCCMGRCSEVLTPVAFSHSLIPF